MKKFYTLIFCLVTTVASSQVSADDIIKYIAPEPQGFYIEASYGYNTRSFVPDFAVMTNQPGIYRPASYLAGSMPAVEVGYTFNETISVYVSAAHSFAKKHTYSFPIGGNPTTGSTHARGTFGSVGIMIFPFSKCNKIKPYLKAAYSAGVFGYRVTSDFYDYYRDVRGGYGMGGSVHIGTQIRLSGKLFAVAEASINSIMYKPKEVYNSFNGKTEAYSMDQSDSFHSQYGFIYNSQNELQRYIAMNFISFRVGIRYNFFSDARL